MSSLITDLEASKKCLGIIFIQDDSFDNSSALSEEDDDSLPYYRARMTPFCPHADHFMLVCDHLAQSDDIAVPQNMVASLDKNSYKWNPNVHLRCS